MAVGAFTTACYAIRAENSISLVDLESGSTLLVLDKDASGESRVEVAWAPNSMKVAIVEDEARGSVVLGAWTDERSIPAIWRLIQSS